MWVVYETESFHLDTDVLGKEKQKDVIKRKDGTKCDLYFKKTSETILSNFFISYKENCCLERLSDLPSCHPVT